MQWARASADLVLTSSFPDPLYDIAKFQMHFKRWCLYLEISLKFAPKDPGLGWLYVFSSFPLCPLPQQLLPLKSKLFELNLTYLAQRIYGSGEMYWMTFPWPWPKVKAVASISKNVLFCAIKWEPLIVSLQNNFIALVIVITWLYFGAVLLETVILANFL